MYNKNFSENGYIIVRNAFEKKLHKSIQDIIIKILNKKSKKTNYKSFCSNLKKYKKNLFELNKDIHMSLIYNKIFQKLFRSEKLYKIIVNLLGKDLSFLDEPSVVTNLPKKFLNKNYYFKDWHQEIWSGADTSSVIIWTPIFQKNYDGQIEIIKKSHTWGHIPHRNRRPINLPKKLKKLKTKLNYTDVIIMHSMLLHRSLEIDSKSFCPRLATPCMLRNFKFKNNSFENNKSWKKFNYSEFTEIERKLGNNFLSPYRLIDLEDENLSKGSI